MPRGGTSAATIYVSDPDSFSHTFDFDEPGGITVRVVGQEEPRDDEGAWGGLYYTVEVTADQTVRPGSYTVPFTVTDSDGQEDAATLYVDVYVDPELNLPPTFNSGSLSEELGIHVPGGGLV